MWQDGAASLLPVPRAEPDRKTGFHKRKPFRKLPERLGLIIEHEQQVRSGMERLPITREGLEKLKSELIRFERVERPANIRAIEEARAHGDLGENAEYHAAKERQSFIAGKIDELRMVIGQSEVVEMESGPAERAVFGRTVLLYDLQAEKEVEYLLVGPYESEAEKGKISVTSPIGKALIGARVGDEVQVRTPAGLQEFEILEIR